MTTKPVEVDIPHKLGKAAARAGGSRAAFARLPT